MPVRRRLLVLRWMRPLKMPAGGAAGPGGPDEPLAVPLGQQSLPTRTRSRSGSPFKIEHAAKWLEPAFFSDLTVKSTEIPRGMPSRWPLWVRVGIVVTRRRVLVLLSRWQPSSGSQCPHGRAQGAACSH
jgi:hypothetical protein